MSDLGAAADPQAHRAEDAAGWGQLVRETRRRLFGGLLRGLVGGLLRGLFGGAFYACALRVSKMR